MEEKVAIIKEIVKHHPSYGTDKGWSTYTGGMRDDGYWYWEKMIDAPDWELREFLRFLEEKEKACEISNKIRMDEIVRISTATVEEQKEWHGRQMEKQTELLKTISAAREHYLLFGY